MRAAIGSVLREAIIAACLTALMILLFLGSWRSTLIIAISIPLSILTSIIILSALHETINIMTLGGLALAVGILVDDATVEIENINRNLHLGKDVMPAILDGAQQIAVPALVSTLCICIVFLPMFFLSGVARYLFVPLAEAVVFAMLASYFWSRTIVPTMAKYLLTQAAPATRRRARAIPFTPYAAGVRARLRAAPRRLCVAAGRARVPPAHCSSRRFSWSVCRASLLVPWLGQDFFPTTDSGQFILHVRAKTGTRIEETARLCDRGRGVHPARQSRRTRSITCSTTSVCPTARMNFMHSTSGAIGAGDADIMVSLTAEHRPTADYIRQLPRRAAARVSRRDVLLPARGHRDPGPELRHAGADRHPDRRQRSAGQPPRRGEACWPQLRHVPGLVDARIHQAFDYPTSISTVDRTKAIAERVHRTRCRQQPAEFAERQLPDLAAVLPQSAQRHQLQPGRRKTAQYRVQSLQDLENTPIGAGAGRAAADSRQRRHRSPARRAWRSINDYNIRRVVDIYGSVQDRDLGGVGARQSSASSTPTASCCRAAVSSTSAASCRRCVSRTSGSLVGLGLRDRAGLSADRRQLPVVARSVDHHHRAAGGAGRHRAVPVRDAHDAERAGVDGRDHVHGRGDREQHSGGVVRQGAAASSTAIRWPRRSKPA